MLAYRSFVSQTPKTKNQKAFSTPLSQKRFAHRHPKLHPHEFNAHTGEKYFDKILVANRGEIACRVIRTAKRLGIKTVAIYSEPDVNSVHVRLADEAYCVGPALSKDSYLNIPNILQAIKESGAQAVHPGYGFLSENPEFVKTLEKNGIVFLGPDSHAMHAMGDKIESKKLAKSAGVNTIPGFLGEVEDEDHVLKISKEIGYPVMIKASSGGGGKGMRIAWNDHEAIEGFRLSKQEARSSFGSDRMLIEKFIDNPRHIEIQVMCDGQGTYLYLPERECSIQRRNQKVIEEAPSVHLDEATRTAMGKQAVALAEAVKYRSAGTVEFLVDSKRNFYFLEMNTRLQVEHPITEYITGIDLVEQMIRVGAGKKLAIQQKDVTIKGWAIESRVYAEDPLKNFLPCIGHLLSYKEPPTGPTVRCDSGIQEGSEISVFYDPLISKLVTWGNDRQEAIKRMATALDLYVIGGLTHNVNFLRDLCEHPRFLSGKLSTKFIPEEFPNGYHGHFLNPEEEVQLAAISGAIDFLRRQRDLTVDNQTTTFDHSMYDNLSLVIRPQDGGKTYTVKVSKKVKGNEKQLELLVTPSSSHSPAPSSAPASGKGKSSPSPAASSAASPADGAPISVTLAHDWPIDTTIFECEVNGKHCIAQLLGTSPLSYKLQFVGTIFNVQVATEKQSKYLKHMIEHVDTKSLNYVTSPMPGMLLSFAVKAGDKVHKGQELAVVEAMKMQNILRAERDGVVKAVLAKPGSEVANEQFFGGV